VSAAQTILGPILNPRANGTVEFTHDGALSCNEAGEIDYVGSANALPEALASSRPQRRSMGVITPPFLDAHTHLPQHPIRGRFMEGVEGHPPEGRLIAGLNRNVFPAEAKFADINPVDYVADAFRRDTMANGVVGGAAYTTVHAHAPRVARLGHYWFTSLVLMNMNCPSYLRTNEATLERDVESLAPDFGPLDVLSPNRFILTDRFAVSVDTPLRKRAVALAERHGLRMQTHLNEQLREKALVEKVLYPSYDSYTDVYLRDGLLDRDAILAHCIHMSAAELDLVAEKRASIAHCPTSNTLLGSGIMPLDEVASRGIDYAICTDVGASPTVSLLAEMAQFLKVHAGRSSRATPSEALFRTTLAPARILHMDPWIGSFEPRKLLSFIEIDAPTPIPATASADDVIASLLHQPDPVPLRAALDELERAGLEAGPPLALLEHDVRNTAKRLENRVARVTMYGSVVYNRPTPGGSVHA